MLVSATTGIDQMDPLVAPAGYGQTSKPPKLHSLRPLVLWEPTDVRQPILTRLPWNKHPEGKRLPMLWTTEKIENMMPKLIES
jgi:hypothetical protein